MKKIDFNKCFNWFILLGMAVAIVLATALKIGGGGNAVLLLVAAFGSLMGIIGTVLSANGVIWNFLFGAVNVAIYAVMCFIGHKYGNAFLHLLYFLPMQFVGFAQWKRRGASGEKARPKARFLGASGRIAAGAALVLVSAVVYWILHRNGNVDTPVADAVSVACNIIGQILLSTAFVEQWIFWIGVNVSSILMWSVTLAGSPEDSFALIYVIKYSFYLLNALNGLRLWLGMARKES